MGAQRCIAVIDVASSATVEDALSAKNTPTAAHLPTTIGGNAGNQFGQQSRSIGMINSGPRCSALTLTLATISSPSANTEYAPTPLN
jgi:hypothetical protein